MRLALTSSSIGGSTVTSLSPDVITLGKNASSSSSSTFAIGGATIATSKFIFVTDFFFKPFCFHGGRGFAVEVSE